MNRSLFSLVALAILGSVSLLHSQTPAPKPSPSADSLASPWGIDTHPMRTHQYENLDQIIRLCHQAGMEWMRVGYGFSSFVKQPLEKRFDTFDQVVDRLGAGGINLIAILQGFDWEVAKSRPDLAPLYNHPEEWRKYIRATVERYHDRIKYWVIWNEQDGGFWKPKPDASQYVPLLKIAYEEIKAIDPSAKVIVGGLTNWNAGYLKEMYAAGAKGYFDIMACHRYGQGLDASPQVSRLMGEIKQVLADNQQADIPLWILESGGTTHEAALTQQQPTYVLDAIRYSMQKLGKPVQEIPTVALAVSPRTKLEEVETTRRWLPGVKIDPIPLDQLKTLDPAKYPILIGAEGKNIDGPLMEPIRDYIDRGGLVLAVGGIPFYTVYSPTDEGIWQGADRSPETNPLFRIGFEAHWTEKGLPESVTKVKTSADALAAGLPSVDGVYVDRFLRAKNQKPGDKYYPIVQALDSKGKVLGEGMALYTQGEGKGGILMSTAAVAGGLTDDEQANLVARMYLTYIMAGVEKIFWYDLHNDGQKAGEKEHNFGLLRWNWTPKPAFYAYKEMTAALGKNPSFQKRVMAEGNDAIWALVFKRAEDGREVMVTWSVDPAKSYKVLRSEAPIGEFQGTEVHYLPLESASTDYRVEIKPS